MRFVVIRGIFIFCAIYLFGNNHYRYICKYITIAFVF